jgi:Animal haem peroxidase
MTPMIRVFDDGFEDGIENLPATQTAESARFDSLSANDAKGRNDQKVPEVNSDMSTAIGQIITHELMKTKKSQLYEDKRKGGFNCCNPKNDSTLANYININKYCLPINVKNNDPCYGNVVKKLNYIRSILSLDNCLLNSTAMPGKINLRNTI